MHTRADFVGELVEAFAAIPKVTTRLGISRPDLVRRLPPAIAILVLDEPVRIEQVVGGLLVVAGLVVTRLEPRRSGESRLAVIT